MNGRGDSGILGTMEPGKAPLAPLLVVYII